MKYIYLNLKRFDVPGFLGGVNQIADIRDWGSFIVNQTQRFLQKYEGMAEFTMFFPELHLLKALSAKEENGMVQIGCQTVFQKDVTPSGNFGAFTTSRPAAAMKAAGCESVIIGHCEERDSLASILRAGDAADTGAVNRILNQRMKCAAAQGMKILYCIGEKSEEQECWKSVLKEQLETGLQDVERSLVTIAYEPVWSIGPGKIPADKEYITKVARFVKNETNGMHIVYGGGLKKENAKMLASIEEIDGGLIALTRFGGEIGFYPEEYLEIIQCYLQPER